MSSAPQQTQADGQAQDRSRKRLASYTVRNMVYSVLAVGVLVLGWWALTFNPQESQRRPPETALTASHAAGQVDWPLWVPEPGEGWTPTVVWLDQLEEVPQTWHISYTSPDGEYVALHQAADVTDAWLAAVLKDASQDGTVTLDSPVGVQEWQAWSGSEDSNAERAYVLRPEATGGSTVVLHGTAAQEEFEEFLEVVSARD